MEVKSGYKQTEVGVIPEEWDVRPLLSTVRIANGQVSPKIEPYKSMVLVAPDHIESSTGKLLAKETASEQGAISGKYVFESGDIVYSKIRPYLRKAILADFSGLCSADMYPLKPATDISAGYILAVILGYRFSKYAESVSVRSGMPKINRIEIAEFSLAVPPPPEQRAIAEALSDVDGLLGALDRIIAKKRDLKQAAMQQLLTGKARLPGFHGEWVVKRLGELATIATGNTPPTSDASNFGDEFPFVGPVDLGDTKFVSRTEKMLSKKGFSKTRRFPKGSILFVSIGSTIGKCGIAPVELTANQQINAIFPSPNFSTDYLYYAVCAAAPGIKAQAGEQAVPIVNKTQFSETAINVPPFSEQTAIGEVLSDMDFELSALDQRLKTTRALKQGMMQELLTGRIRLV